mgnify:FL=1
MKLRNTLLGLTFLVSGTSNAVSINGSLEISGGFQPIDAVSSPVGLDVATGIDFTTNGLVVGSAGDLTTLFGSTVTMTDFQFDPDLVPNPVTLWSVNTFSFSMDTVTINTNPRSTTNLSLSGSGTVSGAGFDPTDGNWEFTANTANGTTFSWSSSTVAVPIPAAIWLFGSGLLGMVSIARRRS